MAELVFKFSSPADAVEDANNPNIKRTFSEKIEIREATMKQITDEINSLINSNIYESLTVSVSGKVPKD